VRAGTQNVRLAWLLEIADQASRVRFRAGLRRLQPGW
jgi:hypothetical protein